MHKDRSDTWYNGIEGTAARTRPLSFDEIVLRRKNKKQFKDLTGEVDTSKNYKIDKVIEPLEYRHLKHTSEDSAKVCSVKLYDKNSINEDKLMRTKEMDSLRSTVKLKSSVTRYISCDGVEMSKMDEQGHGKRKPDIRSGNHSEDEYEKKRYSRSLNLKSDITRYSERERSKRHTEDDGRWVQGKKNNDDLLRYNSGKDAEDKHSGNSVGKDKYIDRNRLNYDKESKRKYQREDDERSRDGNVGRKHNSEGKVKIESLQIRNEESRSKRRRSRSRERDRGTIRRSVSPSSKVHKRAFYDIREHGLCSHPSKDRSERPIYDVDQKKKSSNGPGSHSQRHGTYERGLGGYSPRKKRSVAEHKISSPTNHSPGKRSVGWDLPAAITETNAAGSVSNLLPTNQTVQSNVQDLANLIPASSTMAELPVGFSAVASSLTMQSSADSVQLTEASRPMRRLYVENLPASVSEKTIMEYLNACLVCSGSNQIKGTHPCISCIMHKEKNQALVEFLTPEDASAALSFDGRSFYGTILKVRRPKDFVESGVHEKLEVAGDISDTVKDSPHKIFIGGISKGISPEMLREIACAFGMLKAYRFVADAKPNEPCAFLEYVDHSITLKACAGLNGMKLGGKVLTAVQAFPDAPLMDNISDPPSYGIPVHAKPLLEKPTSSLKLKNVLDPVQFLSLSESELEEILEDVRLECARFGTVKSVQIVKCSSCATTTGTCVSALMCENQSKGGEVKEEAAGFGIEEVRLLSPLKSIKQLEEDDALKGTSSSDGKICRIEHSSISKQGEEDTIGNGQFDDVGISEPCSSIQRKDNRAVEANSISDNRPKYEMHEPVLEKLTIQSYPDNNVATESLKQPNSPSASEVADNIQTCSREMKNKLSLKEELEPDIDAGKMGAASMLDSDTRQELDDSKEDEIEVELSETGNPFEPGCILVEFRRVEASCMAAHCLHGRLFEERIVTVEYIADDVFRTRFPNQG